MSKLIKDGDIILDGTLSREEKEKQAFQKLEMLEDILGEDHVFVKLDEYEALKAELDSTTKGYKELLCKVNYFTSVLFNGGVPGDLIEKIIKGDIEVELKRFGMFDPLDQQTEIVVIKEKRHGLE